MSDVDVRALLDADIADKLATAPVRLPVLSQDTLPAIREGLGGAGGSVSVSSRVSRSDHALDARGTASVRVHQPANRSDAPLPVVYSIHGGWFVLGSNRWDDARLDRWCQEFSVVGVSIDYRLAPEHPYPIPLEDCYAGLAWIHDHAADLGIDPTRVGIMGASAGGGLAAGLALLARDRGEYPVAWQLLMYPMIDDRLSTPSSQWVDPIWPPGVARFGWDCYLRDVADDPPIHAAPARATDLAGLPPALVTVGGIDGFSDEDIDYASRLRHAGVPTELHVYSGAPHAYDMVAAGTPMATRAARDIEEWLRTHL